MKGYFTSYDYGKSMKILSLYYHKFMRSIEEHEGNKYLMKDDWCYIKSVGKW